MATERVRVWQCIGCGRIDGPQPCIGICEDRPAEIVYAAEHDRVLDRAAAADRRVRELEDLLRKLAVTRPGQGSWERSYRFFQEAARRVLAKGS